MAIVVHMCANTSQKMGRKEVMDAEFRTIEKNVAPYVR
jgi:hypothetical protein